MKLRQNCGTCNCGGCCPGDNHASCPELFTVALQWDNNGCPDADNPNFDDLKPFRCNTVNIRIAWDDPPAWLTALLEVGETLRYSVYMSPPRDTRLDSDDPDALELCGRYWGIVGAPVDPEDYPADNTICPGASGVFLVRQVSDPEECRLYAEPDPLGENGILIPRSRVNKGIGILGSGARGWMYPNDCAEAPDCSVPLGCHCNGRPGNLFLVAEGVNGGTARTILTCSYCLSDVSLDPIDSCIDQQCCPDIGAAEVASTTITLVGDGSDLISATATLVSGGPGPGSAIICWGYAGSTGGIMCEGGIRSFDLQCKLWNHNDELTWVLNVSTYDWSATVTLPTPGTTMVGEYCGEIGPPSGEYAAMESDEGGDCFLEVTSFSIRIGS